MPTQTMATGGGEPEASPVDDEDAMRDVSLTAARLCL